jgi:hypothetical protein
MPGATIDRLMIFGLSALRFIVAVCFFSFNASIRLPGSLSVMCPARFGVRQPFERLSRACVSVESKVSSWPRNMAGVAKRRQKSAPAHDRRRAESKRGAALRSRVL